MIWAQINIELDADANVVAPGGLANGDKILLQLGEYQVPCRLILTDRNVLFPGESAEARCIFDKTLEAQPGDTCFLVSFSTAKRIGSCTLLRMHRPLPGLGDKEQVKARLIEERLLTHPYQPVLWSLIAEELFYFNPAAGEELRQYLENTGVIVSVADDLYFHIEALNSAEKLICEYLEVHESISVGQARDLLGSSRKFVVPLLEYFDTQGITVRRGDRRFLGALRV